MIEVFAHPEHIALWHAAARGEPVDWHALFSGYRAAVDWPVGSFWPEVAAAFPDALILLSTRERRVVVAERFADDLPGQRARAGTPWHAMSSSIWREPLHAALDDREAAIAAYERHNAEVRARAPKPRLLEWTRRTAGRRSAARSACRCPTSPFRTPTRPRSSSASTGPRRAMSRSALAVVGPGSRRGVRIALRRR